MRLRVPWSLVGAAALGVAMLPGGASPAAAAEQELVRPVTFTFGGQEVTCWARHWDWLRSTEGQTSLYVGTALLDGSPEACLDAARHAEVTITYRRADGSQGYATAASPGGHEVTAGVIEPGALSEISVAHFISYTCDGERCNAGDYVITNPK
jgi:hypothetical protein